MRKIALLLFGHGPKLRQGYEEGLDMMKKVEEVESRLMGDGHKKTRRTRFELLDMHKRANVPDEALDLRARLQRSSAKKADKEANNREDRKPPGKSLWEWRTLAFITGAIFGIGAVIKRYELSGVRLGIMLSGLMFGGTRFGA
ncbi:hypothetical protein QIS74_06283 [Colletotrichum tabaci]|uniref:Uncharacterized protein n=1 Tax=Colletotrichum tabaci TaxID=1209068 RepID=A0AAV9TCG2_9PEZI